MFVYYRNADESSGMAQARSQVLRFGRENKFSEDKIFVFNICLNKIILGTKKFWWEQNIWGGTSPECPHRGYGPAMAWNYHRFISTKMLSQVRCIDRIKKWKNKKNESNTVYVQTKTTNNNKMDLNIQAKGKGKQLTCYLEQWFLTIFSLLPTSGWKRTFIFHNVNWIEPFALVLTYSKENSVLNK